MKCSVPLGSMIVSAWFLSCAVARADPFTLDVEVKGVNHTKAVKADSADSAKKRQPRATLKVAAADPLAVSWTVTRDVRQGVARDVIVHFFVVKEEKAGQAAVPKLDKDVVLESALTMDFKPGEKSSAALNFTIKTPGTYLLRLETLASAKADEIPEPFVALDLVVQ